VRKRRRRCGGWEGKKERLEGWFNSCVPLLLPSLPGTSRDQELIREVNALTGNRHLDRNGRPFPLSTFFTFSPAQFTMLLLLSPRRRNRLSLSLSPLFPELTFLAPHPLSPLSGPHLLLSPFFAYQIPSDLFLRCTGVVQSSGAEICWGGSGEEGTSFLSLSFSPSSSSCSSSASFFAMY
jgi:hypothetical protein